MPKWSPRPPFSQVRIISDEKYLRTRFCQFHFLSNILYELNTLNRTNLLCFYGFSICLSSPPDTITLYLRKYIPLKFDLLDFEDQLNVALKTDYKYFLTIKLKEIFGRYLPLEGGLWQKCYFQIFCSAWANWPTHKISDLSDPPFMFFANNFANIWCIWSNPKTIIKFWQLGII